MEPQIEQKQEPLHRIHKAAEALSQIADIIAVRIQPVLRMDEVVLDDDRVSSKPMRCSALGKELARIVASL